MDRQRVILAAAIALGLGWAWLRGAGPELSWATAAAHASSPASAHLETAVFAGGCFWSTETDFDQVEGVVATTSGYTGGDLANPTYEQVSRGGTGHVEAVEVMFDPAVVSYERLLDYYWRHVDPFAAHRQFCDIGAEYRPAIFVRDAAQRSAANASKARIERLLGALVVVEVADAAPFYRAEEYHQDYARKNPIRYRYYRWGCGRDRRLERIWGRTQSPKPEAHIPIAAATPDV